MLSDATAANDGTRYDAVFMRTSRAFPVVMCIVSFAFTTSLAAILPAEAEDQSNGVWRLIRRAHRCDLYQMRDAAQLDVGHRMGSRGICHSCGHRQSSRCGLRPGVRNGCLSRRS